MKRLVPVFLISILFGGATLAQQPCATHIIENQLHAADPELKQRIAEYDSLIIGQGQFQSSRAEKRIIPVVFHIIHDNGAENITNAQVHNAVRLMNAGFNAENEEIADIVSAFTSRIGVGDIEFRLAAIDEFGDPTNGIDRYVSAETHIGDDGSKKNYWGPNSQESNYYFNIWTTDAIWISGAAAYAYRPGNAPSPGVDGVISNHRYVGSIGTGSPGSPSTTLTHETGHFLNLPHTWGPTNEPGLSTNCGFDDGIFDTPNCMGVGNGSCNLSQSTCGSLDNVQNFMDYASCEAMFTEGQVNTMRSALNSGVGSRNQLWSTGNLSNTGVTDLTEARIFMERRNICRGETVTLFDESRYDPDSWNWEITGPENYTSTDQHPEITFTTAGDYSVQLTVTQGGVTKSVFKENYFTVAEVYGSGVPWTEDFNEGDSGWIVDDWDMDNQFEWNLDNEIGYDDNASYKLYNFSQDVGHIDDLIYSSIDTRSLSSISMTFRVAFAMRESGNSDKLELHISDDCGESWRPVWSATAATLAGSNGIVTSIFEPDSQDDWKQFSVSGVPVSWFGKNTLLRFRFNAGGGNQLYLDDINLSGTVKVTPYLVYPDSGAPSMNDNVVLEWTDVPSAQSYDYELDTSPNFNSSGLISGSNSESQFASEGLTHGEKYYWRARSVTSTVPSAWSNTWEFTVGSDGVGIGDDQNQVDFKVYPNPASNNFTIQTPKDIKSAEVALISIDGRIVESMQWNSLSESSKVEFDVTGVPAGTYILNVTSVNKTFTATVSVVK